MFSISRNRLGGGAAILLTTLLVWSCSSSTSSTTAAVTVSPTDAAMASIGETVQMTATALDGDGNTISGATVAWTTSDALVANVDANGVVTATGNGTATITATVDGVAGTSSATVTQVATQVGFVSQPNWTPADSLLNIIQVTIRDALGSTVPTATGNVSIALSGTAGGTLSGTTMLAAVAGVVNFDDLAVDMLGAGYTLTATSGSLTMGTSDTFEIVLAFTQIAVGEETTCGLIASGAAYCWGTGSDGQLGQGSNASSDRPLLVSGGHTFTDISGGGDGVCGLVGTDVYCWGDNSLGQLGTGTFGSNANTPQLVTGSHTFATISAGDHRCAVTTAGDAYCWGTGYSGQLGDGNSVPSATPVLVSGSLTWTFVAAGGFHTCGLTTTGDGYCWGLNTSGQMGVAVTNLGSPNPQIMNPARSWSTITAGRYHSCGIIANGTEQYCWGANLNGQLGNGLAPIASNEASRIQGHTFVTMHAGSGEHSCAIDDADGAFCWGWGIAGQLGNGGVGTMSSPFPVSTLSGANFYNDVRAGSLHSCGIASTGAALCWGLDRGGSLGNPGTINTTTPVPVAAPGP